MSNDSKEDFPILVKLDFLKLIWEREDDNEAATDKLIPNLGSRIPVCLEHLGTVLSLLDRMASCWWTCRRGDHLVEYLCGRVASNARAALRMIRFGFYDEALLLCRSIGETSNLLNLFALDSGSLSDWKAYTRRERLNNFSPMKVRKRLEKISSPLIDEDRYRLLSERAAHANPETRPQSHNILQLPSADAHIQQEGIVLCVNELAISLLPAVQYGAKLLDLDSDVKAEIISETRSLSRSIGSITITEIDEYHNRMFNDQNVRDYFESIGAIIRHIQSERHNK